MQSMNESLAFAKIVGPNKYPNNSPEPTQQKNNFLFQRTHKETPDQIREK